MDFKKQSKAANAKKQKPAPKRKNECFLYGFIIFGESRKIQNRRQNARKAFVVLHVFNGFHIVRWAIFFVGPCHAPGKFQPA